MQVYRSGQRPIGQAWLDQVFRAKSVMRGGVIRRRRSVVAREIGCGIFEAEVRRRGYHLLMTDQDYIVVCNPGPVTLVF